MQKETDDDLDDLLDEALNDFEREESKPAAAAAVEKKEDGKKENEAMQEELEASLSKLELPPELDEFRRALLQSFQSVAQAAEQPAAAAAAAGAGGDGEEDGAMMEAFLKDVLSKDVLYEPFRDMRNMYPSWLAANRDKLPADEYARFEKQSALLVQICTAYETNASFDTIAVLMEQISSLGQAPAEMLKQLTPDGGGAPMPPNMENCVVM